MLCTYGSFFVYVYFFLLISIRFHFKQTFQNSSEKFWCFYDNNFHTYLPFLLFFYDPAKTNSNQPYAQAHNKQVSRNCVCQQKPRSNRNKIQSCAIQTISATTPLFSEHCNHQPFVFSIFRKGFLVTPQERGYTARLRRAEKIQHKSYTFS